MKKNTYSVQTYDVLMINPCHHGNDYYSPIGINILSTILKNDNFKVGIIDFQRQVIEKQISWAQDFFLEAEKLIQSYSAKVFCFSCMNVGFPWAVRLAQIVNKLFPESKIVFGGPHATLLGESILNTYSFIDIVATNEGEKIISNLMQALINNDINALEKCKNIYFRNKDKIVKTGTETFIDNLDVVPIMELDDKLLKDVRGVSVEAGRGCPYKCSFCSSHSIWSRKPRFKSADHLIRETLVYLDLAKKNNNYPLISYEHDDFLSHIQYFTDFANRKIEMGLKFIYGITTRVDHMTDSTIDLLSRSNCVSIFMGLETGSQDMQTASSKRLKVASILPTIIKIKEHKIHISANFIVGFPEERKEDVYKTFDLMSVLSLLGCTLNMSILGPEPGSDLGNSTNPEEYVILKNTDYYLELIEGGMNPENMNPIEISHLLTIRNKNYNIEEISWICKNFQTLVTELPYLTYILKSNFKHNIENFIDTILYSIEKGKLLNVTELFEHISKYICTEKLPKRFFEFTQYEISRNKVNNNDLISFNPNLFGSDMPKAYFNELKRLSGAEIERIQKNYLSNKSIIKNHE